MSFAATSSSARAAVGMRRGASSGRTALGIVRSSSQQQHRKQPAYGLPVWLLPFQKYRQQAGSFSSSSNIKNTPSPRTTNSHSKKQPDYTFPTHLSNPTPYDIFHFTTSRNVSSKEVKLRYYDLVRVCHPDRCTSSDVEEGKARGKTKTQAEEEFKLVVQAYSLLKDPRKKQLYDRAGIGWSSSSSSSDISSAADPWRNWQDLRYTRRSPPGGAAGHDRFGWQNQTFYSNQYNPHHPDASSQFSSSYYRNGWNGGNGKYTTNGIFISTLFVLTWLLAGLQYGRLSLQSAKAVERADRNHLDAARSLMEARETARSQEGKERWAAFRRRARERKFAEEMEMQHSARRGFENDKEQKSLLQIEAGSPLQHGDGSRSGEGESNPYGVGHGGPSGKHAAEIRFAKAQAQGQASTPSSSLSSA